MKIEDIKKLPTIIELENGKRYNEILFRSYHIIKKVKELLNDGTNPKIILEVIEKLENSTHVVKLKK